MIKILFVCHGNICRSPMAEFIMKDLTAKMNLTTKFEIASAATSTEEIGNSVHPGTTRKLKEYGISTAGKYARQMTRSDYKKFDYIIGMDRYNIENILRISGGDLEGKVYKLLDFTERGGDIADPWYTGDFNRTYQDVFEGCSALLKRVMVKMKKAVVFDMDGVLIDSEQLVIKSWKRVAEKYGGPLQEHIEEVCIKSLGTNSEETKRIFKAQFGEDFPYDAYKKEASAGYHEMVDTEGLPVKAGVFELLNYLKKIGFRIGLASSTRTEVVIAEMKMIGAFPYFDVIVGGDMPKAGKPEPDIYWMACEMLGIEPEEAYAIEDSYNGIRSAYRAGLSPIMTPDLVAPNEEMRRLAYSIQKSLLDVREFLMQNH